MHGQRVGPKSPLQSFTEVSHHVFNTSSAQRNRDYYYYLLFIDFKVFLFNMAFINVKLKAAVLFLVLLCTGVTNAMQVTSTGPQTIQKAKGESVTMGCTYSPASQDTGELDIEWSNVSPDMTQKDSLILSYTGGSTHYYGTWGLKDRLKFTTDPKNGDASVTLSNLQAKDTGTYQCKVKKAPGVDTRKVTLVVMVPPSRTKCWVEGGEEKGSTVSLRCKASEGSIPLTYSWTRETGGPMPAAATQDYSTGELLIKNHTDSYVGTYVCVVSNAVGSGQCKYELRAYNPTNKVGVIVGAVIGALLLLLLLLLLIWLICCCCCNKKRGKKERANEIREDVPAPEIRPSSRTTSVRSVLSYHTHHGVQYSSVRSPLPGESAPNVIYGGGSQRNSQRSNADIKRHLLVIMTPDMDTLSDGTAGGGLYCETKLWRNMEMDRTTFYVNVQFVYKMFAGSYELVLVKVLQFFFFYCNKFVNRLVHLYVFLFI
ncbi:hypothetical protein WMY93_004807 [Mugilogobius chulae]|uniref:Ig-like domain-containing protein n=1 Tax=Mugilogobius chulae TaxID=88201 RepID=A0AAW0Q0A4_9GOBI